MNSLSRSTGPRRTNSTVASQTSPNPIAQTKKIPNYAQPTTSFKIHRLNRAKDDNQLVIFKAGESKQSRPSSVSTVRQRIQSHSNSNSKTNSPSPSKTSVKNKPPFVQLFNDCSKLENKKIESDGIGTVNGDPKTVGDIDFPTNRSSSYRSPSLVHKILLDSATEMNKEYLDPASLKSIIKQTDALIETMGMGHDFFPYKELDKMRQQIRFKKSIPIEEGAHLIKCYSDTVSKFQEKIMLDHRLIQNILELNNYISTTCKTFESKSKELKEEINILRNRLQVYESKNYSEFSTNSEPFNKNTLKQVVPQISSNECTKEIPGNSNIEELLSSFQDTGCLNTGTELLSQFTTESISINSEIPDVEKSGSPDQFPFINSIECLINSRDYLSSLSTGTESDSESAKQRDIYKKVYSIGC